MQAFDRPRASPGLVEGTRVWLPSLYVNHRARALPATRGEKTPDLGSRRLRTHSPRAGIQSHRGQEADERLRLLPRLLPGTSASLLVLGRATRQQPRLAFRVR